MKTNKKAPKMDAANFTTSIIPLAPLFSEGERARVRLALSIIEREGQEIFTASQGVKGIIYLPDEAWKHSLKAFGYLKEKIGDKWHHRFLQTALEDAFYHLRHLWQVAIGAPYDPRYSLDESWLCFGEDVSLLKRRLLGTVVNE